MGATVRSIKRFQLAGMEAEWVSGWFRRLCS
jgi:hypothetical protein